MVRLQTDYAHQTKSTENCSNDHCGTVSVGRRFCLRVNTGLVDRGVGLHEERGSTAGLLQTMVVPDNLSTYGPDRGCAMVRVLANKRPALDAAGGLCFHFARHCRRASEAGRWATGAVGR